MSAVDERAVAPGAAELIVTGGFHHFLGLRGREDFPSPVPELDERGAVPPIDGNLGDGELVPFFEVRYADGGPGRHLLQSLRCLFGFFVEAERPHAAHELRCRERVLRVVRPLPIGSPDRSQSFRGRQNTDSLRGVPTERARKPFRRHDPSLDQSFG